MSGKKETAWWNINLLNRYGHRIDNWSFEGGAKAAKQRAAQLLMHADSDVYGVQVRQIEKPYYEEPKRSPVRRDFARPRKRTSAKHRRSR